MRVDRPFGSAVADALQSQLNTLTANDATVTAAQTKQKYIYYGAAAIAVAGLGALYLKKKGKI